MPTKCVSGEPVNMQLGFSRGEEWDTVSLTSSQVMLLLWYKGHTLGSEQKEERDLGQSSCALAPAPPEPSIAPPVTTLRVTRSNAEPTARGRWGMQVQPLCLLLQLSPCNSRNMIPHRRGTARELNEVTPEDRGARQMMAERSSSSSAVSPGSGT